MTISCAGMAPYTSYLELICQVKKIFIIIYLRYWPQNLLINCYIFQVLCAGILRLITVYYQSTFDKIIKKCKLDREYLQNNKT